MTNPTKPRFQVLTTDSEGRPRVIECVNRAQANRVKAQFADHGKKAEVWDTMKNPLSDLLKL